MYPFLKELFSLKVHREKPTLLSILIASSQSQSLRSLHCQLLEQISLETQRLYAKHSSIPHKVQLHTHPAFTFTWRDGAEASCGHEAGLAVTQYVVQGREGLRKGRLFDIATDKAHPTRVTLSNTIIANPQGYAVLATPQVPPPTFL